LNIVAVIGWSIQPASNEQLCLISGIMRPVGSGARGLERQARIAKLSVASMASCQRSSDAAWSSLRARANFVTAAIEASAAALPEPLLRIDSKKWPQRFDRLGGRKASHTVQYMKRVGSQLFVVVTHARCLAR
jgi:hypothetical protein